VPGHKENVVHATELTHAVQRLRHAPWPSSVTDEALRWLAKSPSKASLLKGLGCSQTAPMALEVLCATEIECEQVFRTVRQAIGCDPALCWALVESLNRLPWYGGIRAFLSLDDPPESSPCVYPFYILARNKLFVPTDMPPHVYAYHYRGLWRLLPVAKSENWQSPHDSVLAIVKMMDGHLKRSRPDPFVVFLSGLLLGRISPLESNLHMLRLRAHSEVDPAVKSVAHQAMMHIRALRPDAHRDAMSGCLRACVG